METTKNIYKDLIKLKNDGFIVSDNVFDVIEKNVMAKLEEEHAEQYNGLDDDMSDNFDLWLESRLDGDELLAEMINL